MAIDTPISLGLSWPLTNPPFGGRDIYFHYGVNGYLWLESYTYKGLFHPIKNWKGPTLQPRVGDKEH